MSSANDEQQSPDFLSSNFDNHPLFKLHPDTADFNYTEAFERCKNYVKNSLMVHRCKAPKGSNTSNRQTKCDCMFFLNDDEVNAVCRYMLYFAGIKLDSQKTLLSEMIRVSSVFKAQYKQRCFVLPLIQNETNTEPIPPRMVCINAVCSILNVGRKKLASAKSFTTFCHGLKDRTGAESNKGKNSDEWRASLRDFFEKLKREGTPFATRIIREETGTITRDDDPEAVALPPHMSKRQCYARWCFEQGWVTKLKRRADTYSEPISQFVRRPHDDEEELPLWPSGTESKTICAWPTFLKYWKTNYPNIKVCNNEIYC